MSFNKVKMLIAYSIIYVSFCIAIINFIGIDFDFRHRLFQNLYGLFGFISIFTWFLLLVAFLQYDGTKKSKWNKLCYKLYLFKDKTPNGRLYKSGGFLFSFLRSIFSTTGCTQADTCSISACASSRFLKPFSLYKSGESS